jgi:hypothetical protein
MPGISTERMTLYLAAYRRMDRVTEGGGVATEHENITVVEIELGKLAELGRWRARGHEDARAGASPENAIPGTVPSKVR